jgi:hypothetical protein
MIAEPESPETKWGPLQQLRYGTCTWCDNASWRHAIEVARIQWDRRLGEADRRLRVIFPGNRVVELRYARRVSAGGCPRETFAAPGAAYESLTAAIYWEWTLLDRAA